MKLSQRLQAMQGKDDLIDRLVWWALTAVIIVTLLFAGYYYWDRYIHIGDQSPLERGVQHLEQLVRENPQDPEARVALAQYYFENGAYDQAIGQARQVLNAFPENDAAMFILGVSYVQTGDYSAAVPPLKDFTAVRSQSPMANSDTVLETALYYLGISQLALNQPQQAIPVLEQAITINATDADALYQLGRAYANTDDHAQAITYYQDAIRFVPDFIEAYQGLHQSYLALGQNDHANYAQGMIAYAQMDYTTAQQYLEPAAAHLPEFAPVHVGLGLTYEMLGNLTAAEASLKHALTLAPDDFLANHALGRVQQSLQGEG
ncbi:MAG: tetratricopeptide repeat protein [Bacteroidetes bacterium]|nr:MAG: tetratricopeptide repeat protein [Bacteroidota bacterium]